MRNTQEKVHTSFKSEDGIHIALVSDQVRKAGFTYLGPHSGQTADWFNIWSKKALESSYISIVFSKNYREKFSKALKRGAE